ncbi:MAG TPA: endolytic transglycosylase MltG [Candidatus Polarisedimenticolia bacterium]|jgi:UPF0755 protein|nr:endolytic transglycosylase MltG [Candidatus Polarisedimenticolia bacterium]
MTRGPRPKGLREPIPPRRILLRSVWAVCLLTVIVGSTVALRSLLWAHLPYRNYGAPSALVDVPQGASLRRIVDILEDHGIVRRFPWSAATLRLLGASEGLKAGEYEFSQPMSPLEVFERIQRGDIYIHKVTVLEGLRSDEIFSLFVRSGFGTDSEFIDAFRDVTLLRGLDDEAVDVEGYLFPDTYALQKGTTARAIVARMVARFKEVLGPGWVQQAKAQGLTVRQAVSLASLIEKETASSEEDPIVASVFLNRLRKGMRLQCDPTVIYALAMRNSWDGNIRKDDLHIDSLYNTYRYYGLTPGPISNPGQAALKGAVAPATTDFLYFVSMNNGRHHFSKTLEEHNRAVFEYQKKPFGIKSLASRQTS